MSEERLPQVSFEGCKIQNVPIMMEIVPIIVKINAAKSNEIDSEGLM